MVALRGMDTSALTNIQAQVVQKYWSMPVPLSLFGALERMLAIPIQISLSVLVLQAFIRRQPGWIILAVVWHALVDAVAIYLAVTAGAYATEGVIAVLAISALAIVYAFRQPRPIEQHPEPVSLTPVDLSTLQVRESLENLEKTRYQE
jgi:uncharacterized membrane protein YhfC